MFSAHTLATGQQMISTAEGSQDEVSANEAPSSQTTTVAQVNRIYSGASDVLTTRSDSQYVAFNQFENLRSTDCYHVRNLEVWCLMNVVFVGRIRASCRWICVKKTMVISFPHLTTVCCWNIRFWEEFVQVGERSLVDKDDCLESCQRVGSDKDSGVDTIALRILSGQQPNNWESVPNKASGRSSLFIRDRPS